MRSASIQRKVLRDDLERVENPAAEWGEPRYRVIGGTDGWLAGELARHWCDGQLPNR